MSRAVVCDNCHSVFRGPETVKLTVEFTARAKGVKQDFCSSVCQRRWFEQREKLAHGFDKKGNAIGWGIRCEACGETSSHLSKEGWSRFNEEYFYGWYCPKEIGWLLGRTTSEQRSLRWDGPEKGYGEMPEPPGLWAKAKKKVKR